MLLSSFRPPFVIETLNWKNSDSNADCDYVLQMYHSCLTLRLALTSVAFYSYWHRCEATKAAEENWEPVSKELRENNTESNFN